MKKKGVLANEKISRRAAIFALDRNCRRVGFPVTDQGGGSGRVGSRRHIGDLIVTNGRSKVG